MCLRRWRGLSICIIPILRSCKPSLICTHGINGVSVDNWWMGNRQILFTCWKGKRQGQQRWPNFWQLAEIWISLLGFSPHYCFAWGFDSGICTAVAPERKLHSWQFVPYLPQMSLPLNVSSILLWVQSDALSSLSRPHHWLHLISGSVLDIQYTTALIWISQSNHRSGNSQTKHNIIYNAVKWQWCIQYF